MYIHVHRPEHLADLRAQIETQRPVAVGEIGLDLFVKDLDYGTQEFFYIEQLKIAKDYDLPMEKVWAVFTEKHIGAIRKYVKDGSVESEPIDGRINDIINYMVLLAAIIDDQKTGEE